MLYIMLTIFLILQSILCWDANVNCNIMHLLYVFVLIGTVTMQLNNIVLETMLLCWGGPHTV